jgi:hypothetical protein
MTGEDEDPPAGATAAPGPPDHCAGDPGARGGLGRRARRVITDDGEVPTPLAAGHIPARPTWLCARCAEPWPCAEKVEQLLAELAHGPPGVWTYVHLYMSSQLVEAAEDLRVVPASDLYEQLMGWIRRVTVDPRATGPVQPGAGADPTTGRESVVDMPEPEPGPEVLGDLHARAAHRKRWSGPTA